MNELMVAECSFAAANQKICTIPDLEIDSCYDVMALTLDFDLCIICEECNLSFFIN